MLSGAENMPAMCPDLFERLLVFVDFAVHPPKFVKAQTKSTSSSSRSGQVKDNPLFQVTWLFVDRAASLA